MEPLMPLAERAAEILKSNNQTVAVAESSTGGLISAALLAVPGASAYFIGGAVIYTMTARTALLGIVDLDMAGFRASSEPYAALLAGRIRERHESVWGLGETGAAGPTGNRYGDAAGHTCLAVAGPVAQTFTLETGSSERSANMMAFAKRGLELFVEALEAAP
jgi:nicotinamide-nucleotide amidase